MRAYREDGAFAFHTPGHKQGLGAHPLLRDLITEHGLREEVSLMEELDDLHEPNMCIAEAERLAAELYGADHAYLMVNGTTGAIHAMLMGTLAPSDTVLVPRNAHRSVIGGLILVGAKPVWLAPVVDERYGIAMGVAPETVRQAVTAHPEAKAALLVYPTYYGVATDLAAIAGLLHDAGMLLLVDEAHGPHLRFFDASSGQPRQALDCGADVVAQSTHKLLGAMTQGSLLLTQGARVDDERIREAASLLQTTSPNQLLMASIDIARMQMATEGRARWADALRLADELRTAVNSIDGLHCLGADDCATPSAAALDRTKVTVNVTGLRLTGPEAEHILRYDYKIQCELSDARNVLFLITYADTDATVGRLIQALQSLAETYRKSEIPSETGASARASVLTKCATDELRKDGAAAQDGAPRDSNAIPFPPVPIAAVDPRTAFFAPKERLPFERAAGRIAAEQIMFYPPGIPILAPGDQITAAAIAYIRAMQRVGRKVVGPEDTALATAKVLKETDNERKEATGVKGKLIIIEAGDGSGKATQTKRLYDHLVADGRRVHRVEFPDYQSDSSALVRMYLAGKFGGHADDVNAYAASTFFAVDRYASYRTKWKAWYDAGDIILADRYTTSNMVHQAVKVEDEAQRDAFLAWLWDLEFVKLGLPIPDAVVFLDMDPAVAQRLIDARAKANGTAEDIHEKDKNYLARCYAMYRLVAARDHWIPVRCSENGAPRSIDAIHADVYEAVLRTLAPLSEGGRTAKRWGESPVQQDKPHDVSSAGAIKTGDQP
ncbi:MAG: aminotransferase class I/II-fold pyridoxal phosphate-dependent enzyme [Selenomonas sp.]|nr:aminotransferase class I/II-fold pyridoxal phosphate-dependent enzyme [Selenomonas sp.]